MENKAVNNKMAINSGVISKPSSKIEIQEKTQEIKAKKLSKKYLQAYYLLYWLAKKDFVGNCNKDRSL